MTTETDLSSPSSPSGGGGLDCVRCNQEPRIAGRTFGKACKAADEKDRRERTREMKAALPCSIQDCPERRYVTPSQVSSYCKAHHEKTAREGRARRAPAVMSEARPCQREACERTFQWSSISPHQRFCSSACRIKGPDEERAGARQVRRATVAGKTWCTGHEEFLSNQEFSVGELQRRSSKCRSCLAADRRRRNETLDPVVRRENQRLRGRRQRFKKYGIDPEDFDALVELCGSICRICQQEKTLVPDHHHARSLFRGAICDNCNTLLGHAHDDPEVLRRAAAYLDEVI